MPFRKLIAARCRCGFYGESFKELSNKACPECGRNLKTKTHLIPGFVRPGAIVDYSSVIGEAPTIRGCIITSEVSVLGETPCVRLSQKCGAVAVEALSQEILKCYHCFEKGTEQETVAIIAHNGREAKKFAHKELFGDWIDLRVRLIKGANVSGLKAGDTIESVDALYRGCYSTVHDQCPRCLNYRDVYLVGNGEVTCSGCDVPAGAI